jgi:hypothetical protein
MIKLADRRRVLLLLRAHPGGLLLFVLTTQGLALRISC